ncbi:MAG: response regulator [Planctomycetes bacterium]|nr:response regulator [Planctomycetota bacterium]MBI3844969.1 response regulator [Planctomycetota bacterium]
MDWRHGIQTRITAITLVISLVAVGASGYALLATERANFDEETRKRGEAVAQTLGRASLEAIVKKDWPVLESNLEFTGNADPDVAFIRVLVGSREVARFRRALVADSSGQEPILTISTPARIEGRELATFELGFDLRRARALIFRRSVFLALGVLATLVLLSVVISLALRRVVVRPLQGLCAFAEAVEGGNLGARVTHLSDDETGLLGRKLNSMATSLKTRSREVERARRLLEQRNRELAKKIEELRRANQAKSNFLASMSHELRTPLNGILGFIDLIRGGFASGEAEAQEFLANARQSGLHLLTLIEDLLDLSRIEAGQVAIQAERVDPVEIVNSACIESASTASTKGLSLRTDVAPNAQPVLADRQRLRQVLLHLLSNAVKFTDEGSIVVRVSAPPGQDHVLFEVEDTGNGIPPEQRATVFEKFLQLDQGTTRKHGGSGLGLAISKNLVERMGGRIWIDGAREGKGTRVRFTIPVHAIDVSPAPPDTEPRDRPLVLVVENDSSTRSLVRTALRKAGHRVAEAIDADGAVKLARGIVPDLVLLDVGLPSRADATYRDGIQAYAALQRDPITASIPIVLLTAHDIAQIPSAKSAWPKEKAPRILRKPVPISVLLEAVDESVGTYGNRAPLRTTTSSPHGEAEVA